VAPGKDLLIANTPEEFIKNIEVIIINEKVRESISISARKKAEDRYSWNSIGAELNRLYEQSLSK
jgi:glycosyltransferase involved in cell wall biosynthesis